MNSRNEFQVRRHRAMQILLVLFSFIFVAVVAYGYYHLLTDFNWFIALIGGLLIAVLAWFFARVAGTGDGGLKKSVVLIIPLFLISAAGVYNSMMVYLEGEQVIADTLAGTQQNFSLVSNTAMNQLVEEGVPERIGRISAIRDALFSEIENPLNCGQGPQARRLIDALQQELPEFQALSNPKLDCSRNQAVIDDYRTRISDLIDQAPWNDANLRLITSEAAQRREALAELQRDIAGSYSPADIQRVSSVLELLQTDYQDFLTQLALKTDVSGLPPRLDIVGVQSLGNVYDLPALFFSRLGEISTYVYLLMALGFDLLLVYLFQLTTQNRVRKRAIDGAIAGAW